MPNSSIRDERRPVLLIDGEGRGDIGVIRSLGLAGIPVHLLTSDATSVAAASRFVSASHPGPPWRSEPGVILEAMRRTAASLAPRPVAMATGDRSLHLLSENRAEVEAFADHDLAPTESIRACLDKAAFAEVAKRHGLPVPDTVVHGSQDNFWDRVATLPFPVFVKPVDRAQWAALPKHTVDSAKGTRVESLDHLRTLYRALDQQGASRSVVQSYVHGPAGMHVSVHSYRSAGGAILASFSARKPRVFPAHAGVGCLVRSERIPEVIEIAEGVLERLDYRGFAILQFKQDREGAFKLLEINCRYSTWTELPTRAGTNFPAIAYAAMTGQTAPDALQREGISWWDASRDLSTIAEYRATGQETVTSFLRSLASVRACAFWAADDPGPFLRVIRNGIRRRWSRRWKRWRS